MFNLDCFYRKGGFMDYIPHILCFVAGVFIGVLLLALCAANRYEEEPDPVQPYEDEEL